MNVCDCCNRTDREVALEPYCMDDNAELTLCRACAKALRREVLTLERIETA